MSLEWAKETADLLKAHVGDSDSSETRIPESVGSDTESNPTESSNESASLDSVEEESLSDEYSRDEDEAVSFQERHSLTAIFKDFFETEEDPHGADDLLELIATLKAAKKAAEGIQS
jgi:hypothetical protein